MSPAAPRSVPCTCPDPVNEVPVSVPFPVGKSQSITSRPSAAAVKFAVEARSVSSDCVIAPAVASVVLDPVAPRGPALGSNPRSETPLASTRDKKGESEEEELVVRLEFEVEVGLLLPCQYQWLPYWRTVRGLLANTLRRASKSLAPLAQMKRVRTGRRWVADTQVGMVSEDEGES